MIVTDDIFVMLLTEEKFKTFTPKEICDAKKYTEALGGLSVESRPKVGEMVRKAVAAGALFTMNRRTMVLCIAMDFRIWMVTFGSSSTWSPARQSKIKSNEGRH
jgi:predicted lactoylglutathione lyase